MSVRDGLLAILSLGPAYGSQLHAEFATRAPHRGPVNVGQIYQTLDRLEAQKLIEPAGTTDDALPLYRLTGAGTTAVSRWLAPTEAVLLEWTELLDRVLIASTLDPGAARRLVGMLAEPWQRERDAAAESIEVDLSPIGHSPVGHSPVGPSSAGHTSVGPTAAVRTSAGHTLAAAARRELASAALAWLQLAGEALRELESARPYDPVKPRRGRRPAAPAVGQPTAD